MGARRAVLTGVTCQVSTHPGLWLDRYLKFQTDDPLPDPGVREEDVVGARSSLVREVAGIPVQEAYRAAFARWRALLEADSTTSLAEVASLGRVVVGLGAKGAAETGIRLDPTWGVPVLPGSALKGLCSTTAHRLLADLAWRKGGLSHRELFGDTDEQGLVHFLDAWWIPPAVAVEGPLHPDVMTSHHQDYYTAGSAPPADSDSPNPIAFVSARGSFLLAVQADDAAWREAAIEILALGLAELGIGAKTNAGYGRMARVEARQIAGSPGIGKTGAAAVADLVKLVSISNAAFQVPAVQKKLSEAEFKDYAVQVVAKLTSRIVRKKAQDGQAWAVALLKAIG